MARGTGSAAAPSSGTSTRPVSTSSRINSGINKGVGAVSTRSGSTQHQAAGLVLGVFVWSWVVLPFLSGGPTQVKNVLRAKFFNEGPDGKQL